MRAMWRLRSSRRPGGEGPPTSSSTRALPATRRWCEAIHLIVSGFDLCLSARFSNLLPVSIEQDRPSAQPRSARGPARAASLLLALLLGGHGPAAGASPPAGERVEADLVAEPAAIAAGRPFWVAVRLRMLEGWHVYWRNPGDSGEAPTISWHLPPGFTASRIVWPTPQRIPVAHLVNFGYTDETMLLTQITPPGVLAAAGGVNIQADVTWLVCQRECIPGAAHLSLGLPFARGGTTPDNGPDNGPANGPANGHASSGESGPENGRQNAAREATTAGIFAVARRAVPRPAPWPARIELERDWATLTVDGAPLRPTVR